VKDDDALAKLARAGDGARDVHNWAQALRFYDELLVQIPLHSGYLVQRAHMMKELEGFAEAETSYRDAIALGAPPADVLEHLAFVARRNGFLDDPYPDSAMQILEMTARTGRGVHSPEELRFVTSGDVKALAALLVGDAQLSQDRLLVMMRRHPKLDDCVAAFIRDESFAAANPALLRALSTAGALS
jgi:hypothetical protein